MGCERSTRLEVSKVPLDLSSICFMLFFIVFLDHMKRFKNGTFT